MINILQQTIDKIKTYLPFHQIVPSNIFKLSFSYVTTDEVQQIIKSLKNTSAVGYDNIPIDSVRNNVQYRIRNITLIINSSLATGEVPDNLKIAKVSPIFKSGNKTDLENYRTISFRPF